MKKLLLIIVLYFTYQFAISQTYNAVLSFGEDRAFASGVDSIVVIPIRINEISGGLVAGFQFFVSFDHNIFYWEGSWEDPLTGIKNFNKKLPYDKNSWLFNDTGYELAFSWQDMKNVGVELNDGEILLEIILKIKDVTSKVGKTFIKWGTESEIKNGRIIKGKTEMYDENLHYYHLKLNDKEIIFEN